MSALTDRLPHASSSEIISNLDRVRVRMRRLIHSRDRPAPVPGDLARDHEPAVVASPVTASPVCPPATDIQALQQALEDSENLIRQGWIVVSDLNQMRRRCGRCESIGALPEPLGMFQGLLNSWRRDVRTAMKAVDNIRAAVSSGRGQP
jgi:hypothetical protein